MKALASIVYYHKRTRHVVMHNFREFDSKEQAYDWLTKLHDYERESAGVERGHYFELYNNTYTYTNSFMIRTIVIHQIG